MLLDTGATKTIARADTVKSGRAMSSTNARLRTATGEVVATHGEMRARICIGSRIIDHQLLVADIEEEFILGMDVMRKLGLKLDLENGVLRVDNDELPLQSKNDASLRICLVEDVTLSPESENLVYGRLDGDLREGCVRMIESEGKEAGRGILVGPSLIRARDAVPVRIMNVNHHPVVLEKNTEIALCTPITAIVRSATPNPTAACGNSGNLLDMVAANSRSLTSSQRNQVRDMVNRFRDVFATDGRQGKTDLVTHKIDTGDARPIRQQPRRLPLAKREHAESIIKEMAEEGVIEPSSSPWVSPVVLVKKKDGSTRFCVDYRQLNNVTKKDSYPLPRIDDTLDTLAESLWFSTLDLKSGYWQVGMEHGDREKTAFTIGTGLWQFTVMPFGLCNAPATFERLMEVVLKGLSWKTCLVYLDDIIVVGRSFQEHLKNLEEVFGRLRAANLKLSPKKCCIFQEEVRYLGHVVSRNGVAVDPDKTKVVHEWPEPRDKHEVRSFLGLCTYYRRFVPGFANIAKPLTRLTEENRQFAWNEECQNAFEHLKQILVSAPVLAYPKRDGKFVLDTDASNVGIGGVLSQVQDGHEKVIGYFSKVLSKPERNYCVTRRELLAVVKSVEHFYKYLYGRKFLLRTDHAALKWLLQFKNPEGQVARWIGRLQECAMM